MSDVMCADLMLWCSAALMLCMLDVQEDPALAELLGGAHAGATWLWHYWPMKHTHTHTHTQTCIYTYTYTHTTHAHTHILRNIHPTDGSIYFFISFAPREKISSSVVKFCSVVVLCRLALSSLHSSTSPLFSFLVCCSFFFLLFCTCISLIY